MCDQLGVVRQGYYRWLVDGPCERERTDAELTEMIREIHRDLHGHPGVRRVWAELVVHLRCSDEAHLTRALSNPSPQVRRLLAMADDWRSD